jgi:hypothetical protein
MVIVFICSGFEICWLVLLNNELSRRMGLVDATVI